MVLKEVFAIATSFILKQFLSYSAALKASVVCGGVIPKRKKLCKGDCFSILNWNINKQKCCSFLGDMRNLIEIYNPDFVILQEAMLTESLKRAIEEQFLMSWISSPNIYASRHNAHCGVLTAARYPSETERGYITQATEPILKTPKSVLFSTYNLNLHALTLLIVNIHAINYKLGIEDYLKQLHETFLYVRSHKGPVILAGDFNTWSKRRINSLLSMARDAQMHRVYFDGKRFARFPVMNKELDHIFYTGRYLTVLPGSPLRLNTVCSSDHFPLVVQFTLKPEV
ncbi:hypothetical protein CHISP_0542 [Chitinispirillum alkaliphilum]|nr:hypothetical protein CHISP_0542 [Chitinispirillum alkaliphilum]